jgi:hypothetical protein
MDQGNEEGRKKGWMKRRTVGRDARKGAKPGDGGFGKRWRVIPGLTPYLHTHKKGEKGRKEGKEGRKEGRQQKKDGWKKGGCEKGWMEGWM